MCVAIINVLKVRDAPLLHFCLVRFCTCCTFACLETFRYLTVVSFDSAILCCFCGFRFESDLVFPHFCDID